MSKFHQGRFHPKNPDKYMGNPRNIVYRSSWELGFMRWCDRSEGVTKWASEEFSIPYVSPVDNRVHRYYPDGFVEVKTAEGRTKKYIVEVKPKKQCSPPKERERVTKSYINEVKTYAVNEAKWNAAREFAKDNGVEFKILTENELGIKSYGTRRLPNKRHK
mgnify:CR=1 FL=1